MTWQNISPYLSQQGTVVIDEKLNGNLLGVLAKTVNYLNQQLPENSYAYPRVQGLADFAFIPPDQFVLVLAQAVNLPGFILDQLPGLPTQGANSYNPSGSSTLPSEFKNNEKLAIGRVMEYKNNPLIVVSTNQDGNLISQFLTYISKPENAMKIRGNILAYNQSGKIEDVNLATVEKPEKNNILPADMKISIIEFWQKNQFKIILIGVVIVAIILLIALYYFLRKRKKANKYYEEYEEEDEIESKQAAAQQYPQYYDDLDEELENKPLPITAAKRGRPRKSAAAVVQQIEIAHKEPARQSIPAEAPRKRGRPPKRPVEAAEFVAVRPPAPVEPIVIVAEKRKRGRPPKNYQPSAPPK
jgi:uncharacterized protein YxeA